MQADTASRRGSIQASGPKPNMSNSSIAALLGTMVVVSAVPGPSDVAVVARSLASGFASALVTVSGIIIADFLFIVLAVYSLAAVAELVQPVFILAKYLCVAYLIGLGINVIAARPKPIEITTPRSASIFSAFSVGFLITLGDPKAILFYMGLFPAFVNLSAISVAETVTIMAIATIAIGGVKASYAYLAEQSKSLFANQGARRQINIVAGILLVVTGIFLLFSNISSFA